jgi:hypothetical protein
MGRDNEPIELPNPLPTPARSTALRLARIKRAQRCAICRLYHAFAVLQRIHDFFRFSGIKGATVLAAALTIYRREARPTTLPREL